MRKSEEVSAWLTSVSSGLEAGRNSKAPGRESWRQWEDIDIFSFSFFVIQKQKPSSGTEA